MSVEGSKKVTAGHQIPGSGTGTEWGLLSVIVGRWVEYLAGLGLKFNPFCIVV